MSIFALGDPHLSLGGSKPMDIFPGWEGYLPKLKHRWSELVKPQDTVVLAGDISWAMKLEDTERDFSFLQKLPGNKLISKGNHDYWWTTVSKMNRYLEQKSFDTLHILHNNAYLVEDKLICGTRGWLYDMNEPQNELIMNREVGRLKASLDAADQLAQGQANPLEKIVFLHYPPIWPTGCAAEIVRMMQERGIKRCYYGHLHGNSLRYAVEGTIDGISYKLISADGLRFCPYKI